MISYITRRRLLVNQESLPFQKYFHSKNVLKSNTPWKITSFHKIYSIAKRKRNLRLLNIWNDFQLSLKPLNNKKGKCFVFHSFKSTNNEAFSCKAFEIPANIIEKLLFPLLFGVFHSHFFMLSFMYVHVNVADVKRFIYVCIYSQFFLSIV